MKSENYTIIDLLSRLKSLGIELRAENGRLLIDAPKGTLSESLRKELIEQKENILRFLADSTSKITYEDIPFEKIARDEILCVSFAQERLWFLAQLEPESIAYNISGGVRLEGRLDKDILNQSLTEIIRRHEILRTTFDEVNRQPVQVISPAATFNLHVIDLQVIPAPERWTRAQRIAKDEAQQPFDLSRGPLFRSVLMQLGEEEHLLIVTMHHIITDGWSIGIFARELGELYGTYSEGRLSPLPELPFQYADFAHWQRVWLQGEALRGQVLYWKQKLSGDLPALQLPTDRPRPAVQRHQGAKKEFRLPEHLVKELNQFSQRQGVTLFMTLLTAFKVLLYRYTGQTDFAVGSPVANRSRSEIESLIGFFVNTLVLRTDLSGNPHFLDLLMRVKETVLGALSNQDIPFEKVVEAVNPKRDMSYSPLFQVMFALQNYSRSFNLPGLKFTPERTDAATSMYDLTLYIWEEEGELRGDLEFDTDLFDTATIERLVGHFEILLNGIVANPEQRVSELPILTKTEGHQVLGEWNNTSSEYPGDKCFHQLFEEQVACTPEAIAVTCGSSSLTYRELNVRVNKMAYYLRTRGVQPDSIVGISTDRSIEMVVGLLAIMKSGGAYVPLDPHFPKDRIEFMLEDAHCRILITQSHLKQNISDFSGETICIDSEWERISKEDEANPSSLGEPNNLAYVIYTSGSTGKPKGVQIPHRALVNFLCSMQKEPGLTGTDTVLSVTTMSFDIFGLELFLPLMVGATVVVAERDDTLDGSRLVELIKKYNVSLLQATPSTWRILIESGWSGNNSLKIICGGEALPPDLVGPLLSRCKEFWNLYGPTETTIWSTAYRVISEDAPILIGRPIANTQTYILDNSLQPLPIGIVGELHIGGDGLSRGYLNRPELTAEKFIPNPFTDNTNARIYKTGDLARYRPDGTIECLGRIDHQVKLRGFRIELGEIEARIKDVESVGNCVCVLREDEPGDQRLVAYYVPRESMAVIVPDLRQYLHAKLPEYMVPQHFVGLESIPLTPNGKVDRKALPKPETTKLTEKTYVAPKSGMERTITAIWQEVLKREKVGIHDNFFELGGHSLLMVQVLNKVKEISTQEVSMVALFQHPTVASLCKHLSGHKTERPSSQPENVRTKMREQNMLRQKELRKT